VSEEDNTNRTPSVVRVAYVAGFGRSGSTLLGSLLGQLDGALTVGELRYLWTRGILESRRCGCGALVPACPLWAAVLAEARLTAEPERLARSVASEARTSAPTTTAALLAPATAGPIVARSLDCYGRQLVDVYRAIQRVSGARVVVDTSKAPGGAWLVNGASGVDLRVIHLVRDPRATAHSWSRSKPIHDGGARSRMVTLGPVRSSAHWLLRNVATRTAFARHPERYRLVRYEDLIGSPRAVLESLAAWLGLAGDLPLLDDHTAVLEPVHAIGGNPDRDQTGVVRLDLDDAWRRHMAAGDRRLSGLVTLPARPAFGYGGSPVSSPWIRRIRRQVAWIRSDGLARMVEEKDLHPTQRVRAALEEAVWVRRHGVVPGEAVPVWVLGVQRSGTNLLTRTLQGAPEITVFSENHRRAFVDYRLRPDEDIRRLIAAARHPLVVLKPLCDTARALDFWGPAFSAQPSRIIWAYRSVDGRVRSALSRFGTANLEVMQAVVAGRHQGMWQAQGLASDDLELVRSFAWDDGDAASAAALFWYLRNKLLFDQGLDTRPRVTVFSYDAFVADPEQGAALLGRFLGVDPAALDPGPVRPSQPARFALHPEIRRRCDELGDALDGLWRRASYTLVEAG
jgi:hypothetical protein